MKLEILNLDLEFVWVFWIQEDALIYTGLL